VKGEDALPGEIETLFDEPDTGSGQDAETVVISRSEQDPTSATAVDPLPDANVADESDPASAIPPDVLTLGADALVLGRVRASAKLAGTKRQIPFSKQFSPKQVKSLGGFLQHIESNTGSKEAVLEAVHMYVRPAVSSRVASYNAVLAAYHYGLVRPTQDALTDFGRALLGLGSDEERLRLLARHILLNLNGVELVLGLHQLGSAGRRLPKDQLAMYFTDRGLASNKDGTDNNAVGEWLEAAGVIEPGGWYRINEGVFATLSEIDLGTVERLAGVSEANQAILEQLALQPSHSSDAGEMQRLLAGRADIVIDGPAFVTRHIDPLVAAGLIEKVLFESGQRRRSTAFRGTPLFEERVVAHLLERFRSVGISVSGPELERPFTQLVRELRHGATTDIRGRALELFALRLLHRLGLQNIKFRPRPNNAEEIDGSAEGLAPVHTRWQVQCKNSRTLDVDHVAKEVGVAVRNSSTVILLVTTGFLSEPARDFVRAVIRNSAYTILRIEGTDVDRLARDEAELPRLLAREAKRAQAIRASVLNLVDDIPSHE
jgi:site-specific DNA-methyltransferase (cytosine-N4-specific)